MVCTMKHIVEACGCRHHYMPHINGQPPICTLEKYYSCYLKYIHRIKEKVRSECECPIPCNFLIFDPTVSFASTSLYATDRLLASTSIQRLEQKYNHAREVTGVMDRIKFNRFLKAQTLVVDHLSTLKKIMFTEVKTSVLEQKSTLKKIFDDVHAAWERKDYLYKYQAYIVQKNFMRARDAMDERTFNSLALGFQEYSFRIETKIKQLADGTANSSDVREAIYLITLNELDAKIDLANRAKANYTQLFGAYQNGTPVFRYKYEKEPRNDNLYITPKFLLKESLNYSSYARKYSSRLGKDIEDFRDALMRYRDLADEAFFNHTLNQTSLYLANVNFMWRGRRYFHSRSSMYAFTIDYPLRVIQKRISDFESMYEQFHSYIKSMEDSLDYILTELTSLEFTILKELDNDLTLAEMYVQYRNYTKLQIAKDLTSPEIDEGINAIGVFFQNIRARGLKIFDGWKQVIAVTKDIWNTAINDKDMIEYFQYKNMTLFLRNYTLLASDIEQNYSEYRNKYDFRFQVGHADSAFTDSVKILQQHLSEFLATSKVDNNFIRENFLQLDIFYRERSYEQITQQVAYDLFALLCDIGGSMGLFVGASVLTVFELFDLLALQSINRVTGAHTK